MLKFLAANFDEDGQVEYKRLVKAARNAQRGREVLFHGTRAALHVLGEDTLKVAPTGDEAVCFTRSAEVAAYWALMPRDAPGEVGGIFVIDGKALKARYRVQPFHDNCWDDDELSRDEREERIWDRDVTDLSRLTVTLIL